ncbi:VCBS repeat-containing protein [Conexibacter stalactiti]|uniref:VCBS repeat-containing protein n=1 Tax=Conexibacter stalactiti TaxID=1940611 RepID=A0ABU4HQP5_9ACTN|nr:VCBS repeat-containing protein [Conexibacter stalactiti]MDW5594875.1 VCBS repeat-containing protein [Conexibacter stalactiti]MEC5035517.1 VCBS repeat-containing protein [Conexibacter stalactiti]
MLLSRDLPTPRRRPLRAAAVLPACLLAVALAAAPAQAELTLAPPDTRTTLDQPEGVVLADVDRDGFDDAVVGNRDEQAIQLFRGSATGFLPPTAHETGHNLPVAVATGDMNGDGHVDLLSAAAVGGDAGRVSVLLGDGAGGFAPAPGSPFAMTTDGPNSAAALRVADITGDGRLDVVAGDDYDLVVMAGDGSGRLLAPAIDTLGFSRVNSIAIGDFVGDTGLDVITGSGQPQTISELYLNRGGRLEFHSIVDETGNAVIAGDLDGAARDDLIFTRMSGDDVGTLLSTGDGSFADQPQIFEAGMVFVAGMALGDVDADGRDDLLVGGEGAVELFAGSGAAGGFATIPGGSIATTGTSFDVALGDVTGDGQPDLVHTTSDSDTLTLVRNLNGATGSGTAAVDFGSAPAGGAAVERTVRVTSGGPGFYRVGAAAVAPAGSGVTIAADGCSGRSLAVGASCELTLRFTPGAAAGAVAATLTLADNTAAGTRSIPLTAAVTALAGGGGRGGGGGGGGGGVPPARATDRTAPRLSALRLSPTSFAVASGATAQTAARGRRAPKRGTTIRFTLSEAARVTLTVERRAAGRRSGRRCVAPTAKLRRARAKPCTRFVAAGSLVRGNSRQGVNAVAFSGRIGRRALPVGRYRLTATAADAAGNRAAAIRSAFTVVRAR